jgi:hypothetical protein
LAIEKQGMWRWTVFEAQNSQGAALKLQVLSVLKELSCAFLDSKNMHGCAREKPDKQGADQQDAKRMEPARAFLFLRFDFTMM